LASESQHRSQAQASISTILCCQMAGLPSKPTTKHTTLIYSFEMFY
jgi:hypothetical protein